MTSHGEQLTADNDEARELLFDLVETPSVTGNEGNCAVRLAAFFEAHDREVWIDDAGNVRAPADDGVLLTSHIDTVPGEIPVRIEETDDGERALWGRGSVDAKGSLSAMAVAAVRTGASFLAVVGEEVDSRGSRYAVDDREGEPDTVVNGEPSGWDGITLGYRGLLGGTYVATSESGHSSRPENNAIQDAMDWWDRVEAAFDPDDWEPVFERVTTKPISFEGGISDDGHSVEATMDVQLRVPPEYTADQVREIADGCLEGGTVNWFDRVEPTLQSPRTPVARAFRAAIRGQDGEPRLLRKTGTSDMNVFADHWDCPMVTYGPGDSSLDHTPREHLLLPEYDRAVAVLETASERLLEEA
ncbi:acetyl-lysine deacetylase [Halobacteriales archaeon QH_2_66_30]|jgi:LysW-gamma-L-lysine carboxypeptidase|nr:MAG: acetyl-lysine deacetylase [Halobacteriales archaeon QH_2_66_30]